MLFKKKETINKASDFLRNDLPSSRRKQFFLLFKYEWRLFILLPFLFLLLFLPYFGLDILKQIWTINNPDTNAFNFELVTEIIKAFLVIIPFLGFGGLCEIHRHLSLNEGVLFWKDFIQGFNFKWVLFGFIYGVLNVILLLLSSLSTLLSYGAIFYFIALGIFFLIIYPIFIFSCTQTSYYTLTFKGYFSNGYKFALKNYPFMFLFSLYPLLPRLLFLIPNLPVFIYNTIVVIFMAFSPIYAFMLYSFCLDKFDENINKDNYPSFYRKGLSEKIDFGETNEITNNKD